MLSVVGEDVELDVQQVEGKAVSLFIKSDDTKAQFQLADLAVIPSVPDLKSLPEFDVEIAFDGKFIDKFIKAKNALSDVDTFTVLTKNSELKLVLGYSNVNSNRIALSAKKDYTETVKPISFSAKYFNGILAANKDLNGGSIKVSSEGLAKVEFDIDDFEAKYYLVKLDNN